MSAQRRSTSTSAFGVGRRENHDSSAFYARFKPPRFSSDDAVARLAKDTSPIHCRDSREIADVLPANSVALVVTSPPYFVGKEYELAVTGANGPSAPADYLNYLQMLRVVFAACATVLEPGGRIAVNVANLGRKPYRSLSADVIGILQDDLGLLLRGEIIWQKAAGATGSVAWGSYRSAANPVLRDISERVIVASKGRMDRARPRARRAAEGLPHENTLTADEFMEATLDVWRIDAESARRVGHPAPFPVELPRRLIDLYTYKGDVVLDPFMGSGTTLVAAERAGRRGIGFDVDAGYCEIARRRLASKPTPTADQTNETRTRRLFSADSDTVDAELIHATLNAASRSDDRLSANASRHTSSQEDFQARAVREGKTAQNLAGDYKEDFQARAVREGKTAQNLARDCLERSGFEIAGTNHRIARLGIQFDFLARDKTGRFWCVDVSGAFTTARPGLMRTDTLWKALGRILVFQSDNDFRGIGHPDHARILLLTSDLPKSGSSGYKALRSLNPNLVFDAIEIFEPDAERRLEAYAAGVDKPLAGFWSEADLRLA